MREVRRSDRDMDHGDREERDRTRRRLVDARLEAREEEMGEVHKRLQSEQKKNAKETAGKCHTEHADARRRDDYREGHAKRRFEVATM